MKSNENKVSIPQWVVIFLIVGLVCWTVYPFREFHTALNDGSTLERKILWLRYAGVLLTPLSVLVLTYTLLEQVKQNKRQYEELKFTRNIQLQELAQGIASRLLKNIWLESPKHKRTQEYSIDRVLSQLDRELTQDLSSSDNFVDLLKRYTGMVAASSSSKRTYLRHLGNMLDEAYLMDDNPMGYKAINRFVAENSDTVVQVAVLSSLSNKYKNSLNKFTLDSSDQSLLDIVSKVSGINKYWGNVPKQEGSAHD